LGFELGVFDPGGGVAGVELREEKKRKGLCELVWALRRRK
jgi:hypothetical protein